MDLSLDSYLMRVNAYQQQSIATCQDKRFNDQILIEWFTRISPARAHQYGTQGMNRFGPRGVLAQIINCYMRWERFKEIEFAVDWTDTMRDLFGYVVIMGIVLDVHPAKEIDWEWVWHPEDHTAEAIFEKMVEDIWEENPYSVSRPFEAMSALALPYALWTEFWNSGWRLDGQS